MKFLCKREFIHSGVKTYSPGVVYVITAVLAGQLIKLDPNLTLGALSFFTPVDEEAINFVEQNGGKKAKAAEGGGTPPPPPKPPTKAELIAIAKDLGIQETKGMNVEQLQEVIAAAQKAKAAEGGGTQ